MTGYYCVGFINGLILCGIQSEKKTYLEKEVKQHSGNTLNFSPGRNHRAAIKFCCYLKKSNEVKNCRAN